MFREEQLVTINGIQVSHNGFKNLDFETSKFSDSFMAIRGFGTSLNEGNLNTIDTLSLEFFIDVSELKEFAYVYSLFKAFGALPIKNKYILDKLKSSLAVERSIVDFKESDKVKKEIDHLIVFLERMSITSLEKTNNGYAVKMIFSLHKDAFNKEEYEAFNNMYNSWNAETGFESICMPAIETQMLNLNGKLTGSMKINIYNIEKLNAKHKQDLMINAHGQLANAKDKDEAVEKINVRYKNLVQFEDLDTKKTIIIENKHITQIELITNNHISNVPLKGEPVGIKSFLGMGASNFTVKMIFDERDSELLEELKTLSDINVSNYKIELEQPLVNMFDFHSATITNMMFNNIESANGVMVTITFRINSYNFFDSDKLNINKNFDMIQYKKLNANNMLSGFYMESIIEYLLLNGRAIGENLINPNFTDYNRKVYKTPLNNMLFTEVENHISGDITSGDIKTKVRTYFAEHLGLYNSWVTCFGAIPTSRENKSWDNITKNSDISNPNAPNAFIKAFGLGDIDYFNDNFNINEFSYTTFLNLVALIKPESDVFFEHKYSPKYTHEFQLGNLEKIGMIYTYADLIASHSILSNDTVKKQMQKHFNTNADLTSRLYKLFLNELMSQLFNTKQSMQDATSSIVYGGALKELYIKMFHILNFSNESVIQKLLDEHGLCYANDTIDFKKIHKYIEDIFEFIYSQFQKSLKDDIFIELIAQDVVSYYRTANRSFNNDYHQTILETGAIINTLSKAYKKAYDNNRNEVINQIYDIFLAKTSFALSVIYNNKESYDFFKNKMDKEYYIKIVLLSSAILGFLALRIPERTDEFGIIFNNTASKISNKFAEFLSKANIIDKKRNKSIVTNFKKNVTYSYYKELIPWNNLLSGKDNTQHDINKDFIFFYGERIETKNPEQFINITFEESINNSMIKKGKQDFQHFIQNARRSFVKGDKYSDWDPIQYSTINNGTYGLNKLISLPTFGEAIMRDGDKISPIMKRRIIGNRDPFMDLEKISNIVHDSTSKIMPDYDILFNHLEYESNNTGAYNKVNLSVIFSMNNMVNVSVSKNSTTKIKTAFVRIVDMNREIIENFSDSSISLYSSIDGKIKLFNINLGDKIEINLGYSNAKKNVFKGYVDKITYVNNILEFACSDDASALYSYHIDQMNLNGIGHNGVKNVTRQIKVAWSYVKGSISSNKAISAQEYINNTIKYQFYNKHLFNYLDNDVNYKYYLPGVQDEGATMFNATIGAFIELPSNIKKIFNGSSFYNQYNLLTIHKMDNEALTTAFGGLSTRKDSLSIEVTPETFVNVNNLDRDYETYGIYFDRKKLNKDSYQESETNQDVISENKVINKKSIEDLINEDIQTNDKTVVTIENTDFHMPTTGNKIVSIYNEARKNKKNEIRYHQGIDISPKSPSALDKQLYAIADGVVVAKGVISGAGNTIKIYHKNLSLMTVYYHMASPSPLKLQDKVKRGDIIGTMGNTGGNYATHLHFETHVNGKLIDPMEILGYNNFIFDWNQIGQTALVHSKYAKWIQSAQYIKEYKKKVEEKRKSK